MTIVRTFTVEVPVTIEAADEPSLIAAKKKLRTHYTRFQSGANVDGLSWRVSTDDAKLTHRDISDDPTI